MLLFFKGFLIGIAKIIPGVSGALLAINFGIYEKLIDSLVYFFNDWKKHLFFLIPLFLGFFISIIIGSKIIIYLFLNFKFFTFMFFLGLLIGGVYNFKKSIIISSYKQYFLIFLLIIIFTVFTFLSFNVSYALRHNYMDFIVFFLSGVVEVLSSIIPGLSGTSLLMLLGVYDEILLLFGNIFNFEYVIHNLYLYFSFGIGMFISLIIFLYSISFCISKYHNSFNIFIFALSISSISYLMSLTFSININVLQFFIGLLLNIFGLLISILFDK